MKVKFSYTTITVLSVLFFISSCTCTSKEGEWDPMKWKTDVKMTKDHSISVPSEGGTYLFSCKNYSGIWLSGVNVNEERQEIIDFHKSEGDWGHVFCEQNTLSVTILPNHTGKLRIISVGPTAGDIFDYFTFKQEGE